MAQISATVKEETVKEIKKLSAKENRSFSEMIDILLAKAVKNFSQSKSTK